MSTNTNLFEKTLTEFSPELKEKIKNAVNNNLPNKERVNLLKEVAAISLKHHHIQPNQHIAIQLTDGKIVETADNEWALLDKMQGKTFPSPIFIWKS